MKLVHAAFLLAACAAGAHGEEKQMVKIVGTVESCRVADVSKTAGVKKLRTYLTLDVETTDPPSAKAALKAKEELIGTEELHLDKGTRVEVTTHVDPRRVLRPLTLIGARAL
jgi:hypothetical protein